MYIFFEIFSFNIYFLIYFFFSEFSNIEQRNAPSSRAVSSDGMIRNVLLDPLDINKICLESVMIVVVNKLNHTYSNKTCGTTRRIYIHENANYHVTPRYK